MGRIQNLKEALFGVGEKDSPKPSSKLIVNPIDQQWGTSPSVTIKDQFEVLNEDALINAVAIHMASEIMSGGIEVEIVGYDTVIDGLTATDYLNRFNERNNLDEILSIVALELVAFGNSFVRIKTNGELTHVPLTGIQRLVPIDKTTPLYEKYDILMTAQYNSVKIPYDEFVHFRVHASSDSLPWGRGMIESLLQAIDEDTPDLMTMRNKLKQSMTNLALRAGAPVEYVTVEGATDQELQDASDEIKAMPYHGARVVSGKKVTVLTSMMPRSGLMDAWNELVERETMMVLGDPILKLVSTPGYTEASSKTAERMHAKKIAMYQRILKRGAERIWYMILKKSAFDPDKANARLRFTIPAEAEAITENNAKFPGQEEEEKK